METMARGSQADQFDQLGVHGGGRQVLQRRLVKFGDHLGGRRRQGVEVEANRHGHVARLCRGRLGGRGHGVASSARLGSVQPTAFRPAGLSELWLVEHPQPAPPRTGDRHERPRRRPSCWTHTRSFCVGLDRIELSTSALSVLPTAPQWNGFGLRRTSPAQQYRRELVRTARHAG